MRFRARPLVRRLAIAALLLLAGGLARAQSKQEADAPAPVPVSLTALINQVAEHFPQIEGEVVEVRGKDLTLSVGERQGVQVGLTFAVSREGREIRHPRTGELLGRTEETVGQATVSQVFDTVAIATLDGSEAKPGDRVQVGSGKARLTLLVFRGGVRDNVLEAVTQELYDVFGGSGRFEVVLGDQIAVWLTQQRIAPEEFLRGKGVAEAAGRFKSENVLAVVLKTVERKPFMELSLFAQSRPEPALSTALFVPSSVKPKTPGQFSASERQRTTPERKPRSLLARLLGGELEAGAYSSGESSIPLQEVARFGFPVLALDMGVPADRVPRLVITDGLKVYLYRVVERRLEPQWTYGSLPVGRVVSVYLVDLDGDGNPEVAVNRYDVKRGVNSMILETRDGKPAVLTDDIFSFLVALDESGSGLKQTLWTQEYSPETLFAKRKVERMALKDRALVSAGRVAVPESFRATGVTTSNIMGKDSRALVYVDEYNRLRITAGPEELWRSSSPVGGGGYLKLELIRYIIRDGISKFFSLEPTPLAVDLDGDGLEEVVVPQNQIPGYLGVIFRGPAGVRFQQVNSGFEGAITGLGAIRGEDKEPPTLLSCVVRFSGLLRTSGESQILMTAHE